jgi:hypothetical protein
MNEVRWFLAHRKSEDRMVENWVAQLRDKVLKTEGWTTSVTAGRDDYNQKARAVGSWDAWCLDVAQRQDYRGNPAYHGVVFPYIGESVVGRATYLILMNFLGRGKYAYAWDVMSGGLYTIDRLDVIDPDDFIQHAQIKLKE